MSAFEGAVAAGEMLDAQEAVLFRAAGEVLEHDRISTPSRKEWLQMSTGFVE